jgi:hypothetical protein
MRKVNYSVKKKNVFPITDCHSGQAGMTREGIFMTVRPALRFLLGGVMVFFVFNPLLYMHANESFSTVLSSTHAYAADEPHFIKEGALMFLEKESNRRITTIDIEIADSDYERTRGLMYRHSLPENAGMLFIFEKSGQLSFWMRNTYIRLDIIFADAKKQIVNIKEKTEPLSYNAIESKEEAKFVVEVNAGFCNKHGVSVGDYITFERSRHEIGIKSN